MSKLIVALFATFGILVTMYYIRNNSRNAYVLQTGEQIASGRIISGSFDKNKLRSNGEWKKILTPKQYYVLRDKGTEIPFTGSLLREKRKGTYVSVGCDQPVFRSEQRYYAGSGWLTFSAPVAKEALVYRDRGNGGWRRIEVMDTCAGHLGYVHEDEKSPTGKRYIVNSAALKFIPD